jgi:DNA polymerase III delta prime subunit
VAVRPVAILMSGAPGSGKSTLARALADSLRLPLVDKDVLREAALFSSCGDDIRLAPWGPGLWYSALESLLDLGVSVIGDMTLFPGVSEPDVRRRLAPRAHLFCVHCLCSKPSARWLSKLQGHPFRADGSAELLPTVLALQESLAEPMDLGCRTLVVDTEDGYKPSIDGIEEEVRNFVRSLVDDSDDTTPSSRELGVAEPGVNEKWPLGSVAE